MIGVSAFIEKIKTIAARDLTYRTGGVGKDGTCDCIGLIMGAMYELGHKKYDLHSTNYFARYQVEDLRQVKNEKELFAGQLLFSARTSAEKLADRYKPGGGHYTGDLLDYYHVEVVTSTNPLEIVECTQYGSVNGIEISGRLQGVRYGAKLKDVLYDGYEEESAMVNVDEAALYSAIVATQEDPLRVREWPKTGTILGKVPKGRTVDVLADAGDGWPKIRYGELTGYVSGAYLERVGVTMGEPDDALYGDAGEEEAADDSAQTTIIDEEGNTFRPAGSFRVLVGAVD